VGQGRAVGVIAGGLGLVLFVLALAVVVGIAALAAQLGQGLTVDAAPSGQALTDIPSDYLQLYQQAAASCPGLPWTVLAGIGRVETDHGRNAHTSSAGAEGPMQFLPATFAAYDHPVLADPAPTPGGTGSITNPVDAIYAAARDLCANGARGGADIPGAIYAYNHDESYVQQVLSWAAAYAAPTGPAADTAVSYALAQLGTPYRWGGDGPGGFDCSGLVQAAYAAAGVALPRVAQAQFDAGPLLPAGGPLEPGDLVFFGSDPFHVDHVGLVVGSGEMVDAPHTDAVVRTEPFPTTVGALWGNETYLGATRPASAATQPGGP
jgi:cell wall-associated NlpC family hydrolase